ncbi:UNVERIFIED_CONTAM: hypothetical protein PYX00_011473 [Menopon gallinae]|uniref:Protein kinase domain-containing protein n=1 Tax=Menopon gallinae TaxID=328185 RepID=A0AAW2H825_9NEOP
MKKGDLIENYRITGVLGKGSFGTVYEVKHVSTGEVFALKLEASNMQVERSQLRNEKKVYSELEGLYGIADIHDFRETQEGTFLVMKRLYKSLGEISSYPPPVMTPSSVFIIGRRMVDILEGIHSRGRIYRDLKPENIMVDYRDQLYLIDFGMSKHYIDPATKAHIKISFDKKLSGTARYVSINMHKGIEQSRRDDLESLGYVLVFLAKKTLPWIGINAATGKEKNFLIGKVKDETDEASLCRGIEGGKYLARYIRYAKSLGFDERPNYDFLRSLFDKMLRQRSLEYESDWLFRDYFVEVGLQSGNESFLDKIKNIFS